MAADSAMRVDLAKRQIDINDMDALAKRLAAAIPAVDTEAVKTLRNARQGVNAAADGLHDTLIEIEGGKARLRNLKTLLEISRKDDAEADKKAEDISDLYDTAVNVQKALIDLITNPLPLGLFSGILELAGGDQVKSAIKDHIKALITQNQELSKHLDEIVVALHDFGRDEMAAEGDQLAKLAELKAQRTQHYHTAIDNFAADFESLPSKGGGKTPPEFQAIIDSYKQIAEESRTMAGVKNGIEREPALRDEDLLKALKPLGTFDANLTKALAATNIDGRSALVYVQDSHHVTLFHLPSGMGKPDLEGLAGRVDKLKLFDAAVFDAAAVAEKWSSTIDGGFGM